MTEAWTGALESEIAGMLSALGAPDVAGIGVDVEEHTRWRTGQLKTAALFTPAELARCEGMADPPAQMAGTWCAKEAAVKALAAYVTVSLREIEVVHGADGRPGVRVLRKGLQQHGERLRISISRTRDLSVAVAVYVPPVADPVG